MELIERYVYDVTRRLPQSQREDVAEELRATINDMLAAKLEEKKPTKKQVIEVLKELGSPEKLACEYENTPQYLISPRWFRLYWKLLKQLILLVPPIVATIVSIVEVVETNRIFGSIATGVSAGIGTAIQIAFWMTLVFAVLDRTGTSPEVESEEWSPETLPELPPKRQISIGDSVAGIVFILIVAGIVAYAATWPAWWAHVTAPVLDPELWGSWIMNGFLLLAVASLLLEGWKLKVGNWVIVLTITNVLIDVAWATFLTFVILTQPLINPMFVDEVSRSADLTQAAPWIVGMSVVTAILSSAWSSGESIYKSVLYYRSKK